MPPLITRSSVKNQKPKNKTNKCRRPTCKKEADPCFDGLKLEDVGLDSTMPYFRADPQGRPKVSYIHFADSPKLTVRLCADHCGTPTSPAKGGKKNGWKMRGSKSNIALERVHIH
ncbi:uncharacterized protein LOC133909962 [Phragmites australis]|uniref:uncharacterized protein LOC133909962 n=1 Tax=Phragmites australis TaxID=29695 RepID=UPI002D771B35|nr:uncharacterized protein LOC133909962 [Phragmites australis]